MDQKEILQVVEVVSNEKALDKEIIFEAVEAALAAAVRKISGEDWLVRVEIDRHTGAYVAFRRWTVVADEPGEAAGADTADEDGADAPSEVSGVQSDTRELFDAASQLRLSQAQALDSDLQPGDVVEEELEPMEFGRIATQMAKQVIVQKVREAERQKVVSMFESRIGEMLVGQSKRMDRGSMIIDLGNNAEAVLPREEMIPRENIRIGDRVCCYLQEVRADVRGPQLVVSRRAPALLIKLFGREVPEVAEGMVEVVSASRDPGIRAKIAVRSLEARIDPIGACVGMHGTRVQSVSNELSGERVDIVLADDNPAQFVINALSPAKVQSITMDEESQTMDIAVAEDQQPLAIGKGGQNVRLASELTGWTLNIMTEEDAAAKQQAEFESLCKVFIDKLELDEAIAEILVQEGFSTIEEIAFVPMAELLDIEEFDEEAVRELRSRAQDVLLTQEISLEEQLGDAEPADDLLAVEGMSRRLAHVLAGHGVITREDLADQSVDELLEIEDIGSEVAAELIMNARSAWFADEGEAS